MPTVFIQPAHPAINLTVDREKCEKLGVNVGDVFTTIQAFMGSLYINDFTTYNRTFHVVVQADTSFRTMISDMDKYYVRNSGRADAAAGYADQLQANRNRAADISFQYFSLCGN